VHPPGGRAGGAASGGFRRAAAVAAESNGDLMLPLATAVACGPAFAGGFAPFFLLVPLFWLIVIVLVVALLGRRWRRGWDGGAPWSGARQAETVLSERYARGDIDETEYRARLEVLRASQGGPRR
jgi:putative membrane protein